MKTTKKDIQKKPVDLTQIRFNRGRQLNVYNSAQINAAGGIAAFSKLIGNDKPIEAPNIEFTEEEWEEIEKILKQD